MHHGYMLDCIDMNNMHRAQRTASIVVLASFVALAALFMAMTPRVSAWSATLRVSPDSPDDVEFNTVIIHASANVSATLRITVDNRLRGKELFFDIAAGSAVDVDINMQQEFADKRLRAGQDIEITPGSGQPGMQYRFTYGAALHVHANDTGARMAVSAGVSDFGSAKENLHWIYKTTAADDDSPWDIVTTEVSGDYISTEIVSEGYLTIVEGYVPLDWTWPVVFLITIVVIAISGLMISKTDYVRGVAARIRGEGGVRPHRMSFDDVLENEARKKILDLILGQPGIHLNEIMRQTGIDAGAVNWHLDILADYHLIKMEKVGQYNAYFPKIPIKNDLPLYLEAVSLMKNETGLKLLRLLQSRGPMFVAELASELEVDKKAIRYHGQRLAGDGLLEFKEEDGKKFHLVTQKGLDVLETISDLTSS